MRCLPTSYFDASCRCVTATDGDLIGVAFDVIGGVTVRVALPYEQAESMALAVLEAGRTYRARTNCQSDNSSGNPNFAESPQEGMKV